MLPLHEPHAVTVSEYGPFAAHSLRHQWLLPTRLWSEPHDRGMELHEFKIGNVCAATQRKRNAITGRNIRIGRLRVDLTKSASCQNDDRGQNCTHSVALAGTHNVQGDSLRRTSCISKEIKDERLFDYLDSCASHGSNECTRDLGASCVTTCVCNAIAEVAPFASQRDSARWIKIKFRAERNQTAYSLRTFSDEDFNSVDIA